MKLGIWHGEPSSVFEMYPCSKHRGFPFLRAFLRTFKLSLSLFLSFLLKCRAYIQNISLRVICILRLYDKIDRIFPFLLMRIEVEYDLIK